MHELYELKKWEKKGSWVKTDKARASQFKVSTAQYQVKDLKEQILRKNRMVITLRSVI